MSAASIDEQGPARLPLLQMARQQSQALAELRSAHSIPFAWGRRGRRHRGGRSAWLTAALAAGVLGLGAVTLVTLHGRGPVAPAPALRTLGTAGPMPVAAPVAPPRAPEPARRGAKPVVAPEEVSRPARRRAHAATRPAQPERPATETSAKETSATETPATTVTAQTPSGRVTFEGDEPGATIIVTPPARQRTPLWTPEDYRKQRAGKLRW